MHRFYLRVHGEWACFTRPECKVERVSYPIITPSAARAIFEAILWKPAIRWHIRQIDLHAPIRWANLRRNEVGKVVPTNTLTAAMKRGAGSIGLYVEDERQQRATRLLRNVDYVLHADLEVRTDESTNKYIEMFQRRATKGQCFNQPYLGTRECVADFELLETAPVPNESDHHEDIGLMLHDLDFTQSCNPQPRFFPAKIENGVLKVPEFPYPVLGGIT